MEVILVILAFLFFIIMIIGLVKENKIRKMYKGVFGRISAYCFMGGVIMLPVMFIMAVTGFMGDEVIVSIGAAAGWAAVSIIIALITKKKCPEHLQKGLFLSMFLVGIGFTFKLCLFFLPFIWKIGMPLDNEQ